MSFVVHSAQQQHGSWISTWSLAAALIVYINMSSNGSRNRRPQHGLRWQHGSWTPTWPSALGGNTDYRSLWKKLNSENEPFFISDMLLTVGVIMWLDRTHTKSLQATALGQSSRPLHTSLLSCLQLLGSAVTLKLSFPQQVYDWHWPTGVDRQAQWWFESPGSPRMSPT